MTDVKAAAATVVSFLKNQLDNGNLNEETREGVEVGLQCIQTAFEITAEDAGKAPDLLRLMSDRARDAETAERLKNEGNELMKADKYKEALEKYTQAIRLKPDDAVFYCNRAAAHFKLGAHEIAVSDCTAALALRPDYSKAHGRMGLALAALGRHREARQSYARASELDPENESYRQNIRVADEYLAQTQPAPAAGMDLSNLLQNPQLMTMATEMLADPNLQNMLSGMVAGGENNSEAQANRGDSLTVEALLEAGQLLAQQMQNANPQLVERLRRYVQQPPQPPQ